MNNSIGAAEVLQSYVDELYTTALSVVSPVGGVLLKPMRKEYIRKEIQSLYGKRKEFVLALTDVLLEDITGYGIISEKIKKIKENPQFVKDFEKVDKVFSSLDEEDQIQAILETAKMARQIFSAMRDDVAANVIGSLNPEHMLILGQALRCGQQMVDDVVTSVRKKPPDMQCAEDCMNFLLVLLTKFLAISGGKMDIELLYNDIAFCIYHTEPQIEGPVDAAAFAILGESE